MKNFILKILKHKVGIGACIVMGVICIAWWVLANPITTSIGEDVTVGNNLTVTGTSTLNGNASVGGRVYASSGYRAGPISLNKSTWVNMGINVNAGYGGGTALILCSLHGDRGNATRSKLYMLRYGYSENNYEMTLIADDNNTASVYDFLWQVDGSGNLQAKTTNYNVGAHCGVFTIE